MKTAETEPVVIELERPSDNMIFMADEYVRNDGTPFSSVKDFKEFSRKCGDYNWESITQHYAIIYCPACKNGVREDDLDIHYKEQQTQGDTTTMLGTYECPYCGTKHIVKRAYHQKRGTFSSLYLCNATIDGKKIRRLKAEAVCYEFKECTKVIRWPRDDGKISLSVCFIRWIPTWFNKKYRLVEKPVNYRIVINPETGQSYRFRGFENGKPSRFSEQHAKMRTVTFWDTYYIYEGPVRYAIEKILKQPISSDSLSNSHLFLRYYLPKMDEFQLSILSRILKAGEREYVKKRLKEIRKFTHENSFDSTPRYMQAKSIKKRLAKNSVIYIVYHLLHRYGFRDVNIMNSMIDFFDKNEEWLINLFSGDECVKIIPEFMKYLIKVKGENGAKHMLLDMVMDKEDKGKLFTDAALSYHALSSKYNMQVPPLRGNIRELHDKLFLMTLEVTHENHIIPYTEEEKALQGRYGGYVFSLARDTNELFLIGNAMSICVGSYGDRALRKMCTIIAMKQGDRFAACIELQKNGPKSFKMVQLKARFNKIVQEIDPVVQWVKKNNIIVSDCYDYKKATQTETSENYFDVLQDEDEEIVHMNQDDDFEEIFQAVLFPAM